MPDLRKYDLSLQTGIDIAKARKVSMLSVEDVRDFLYNGRDGWEKKRKIMGILERDPVFDKSKNEYMTATQRYERGMEKSNRLYELQSIHGWNDHEAGIALDSVGESLPITLQAVAFQPVFMLQGGPDLVKKYGHLISSRAILGCYLQTELGHGSNLSRLETTATFVPETREFEIHSPSLTSTKWWIGALGKTATHGVVQARLILPSGKDMGPHLFFVQLRSLHDHKALPGITMGDIGPKVMGGYAAVDNGFAHFNRIRIPKENMLSAFSQVTDDGQYVQPPHAKIVYGGMLYIRSSMVTSGGWVTARAATIAIRYATVRRQGGTRPSDDLEKQTIFYPSVYSRLLPILSRAFVFIRLGRILTSAFTTMTERLKTGDTSLLSEVHATTSGLKVYVSTNAANDIEVARRSMGGHGYSAFSGLGMLYADYLPATTYEGDNFVLDQQVVRASLKAYRSLFSSNPPSVKSLSPFSFHLRHLLERPPPIRLISQSEWRKPAVSISLLELRAALLVQDHVRNVGTTDASINQRISNAVTEAFVAIQVGNMINGLAGLQGKADRQVVENLYLLYLLTTVERGLVDILAFGLLPPVDRDSESLPSLRDTINLLCLELVPEAISLTDAFGFTDWELDSALGVFNGKVYESLWERVMSENKSQGVTDAYDKSIKRILQRGRESLATGRHKL